MNVKFKTWEAVITFAKYGNYRPAIQLFHAFDGSLIATASVNLPDEILADGEIAIKDYAENEGMLVALFDAGIISLPKRWVNSGFVRIPICDLMISVGEGNG